MQSSPEPGQRAVILDANALSRLARVHQADVLPKIFPGGCYLAPAIYHEIEAGVEAGVTYLEEVMALVERGELRTLGCVQCSSVTSVVPTAPSNGEDRRRVGRGVVWNGGR